MKSEANKSFKQGFTLNEQELRRLYDIVCQQMKNVTKDIGFTSIFEMKFHNGVIANPLSLDEIISQENMGSAAIRRLSINLIGNDNCSIYKISLQFLNPNTEDDENNRSIKYRAEGEDRDWVFVTSSQIEERIGRIKTMLVSKWLSSRNFSLIFMMVFTTVFMFTFMNSLSDDLIDPRIEKISILENQWNKKEITDLGQLMMELFRLEAVSQKINWTVIFVNWKLGVMLLIMIFILSFGIFGEELLNYLFPPYNFLWGDYIKFYENRKSVRNFIFVIVILGLFLSVLANYIYDFLTR